MSFYLGIDTSNYTTSAAIYDSESGKMLRCKKLLPVRQGECGLRQSDAVFHHVQQLPQMISEITRDFSGEICAIGVSSVPRDAEGSYMPCFTVGTAAAEILSSVMRIPLYKFSHQSGHIAAALYSSKKTELIEKRFLAFHVSGGTTEGVIVTPDKDRIFTAELAARTLDLNAGQLIDRIGVMLGLSFPCGAALEQLAVRNERKLKVRPTLKGADCCLSGIENICRREYESGESAEYIAALCLEYVEKTVEGMCRALLEQRGMMQVLFAGGVMSDRLIRNKLEKEFEAYFAEPEFSADNACGTAFLCFLKHKMT